MTPREGPRPAWMQKYNDGKMFRRMDCGRCGCHFLFGEPGRASRTPRCPGCGAAEGLHQAAA